MALNIKDPETDELARQVAQLADESITTAVKTALEERRGRLLAAQRSQKRDRRVLYDSLISAARSVTPQDPRSADEILGYDENGLPS